MPLLLEAMLCSNERLGIIVGVIWVPRFGSVDPDEDEEDEDEDEDELPPPPPPHAETAMVNARINTKQPFIFFMIT